MTTASLGTEPITVHRSGRRGAPVVVLVHGATDDGRTWPDLVDRWAATWDLHALDLPRACVPPLRGQLLDDSGVRDA